MIDPLAPIRDLLHSRADAIRWAGVLEATAPKVGNVYPGRHFPGLSHADFIIAAEIAADWLPRAELPLGERIGRAVERTVDRCGTNVNLGILLLLGPLVLAEESLTAGQRRRGSNRESMEACSQNVWREAVERCLETLGTADSQSMMQAIAAAAPGGMGRVEEMDVHDPTANHSDLIAAMRTAAVRDRIARQYASGFDDLFNTVVPLVDAALRERGELLAGIALAHLRLLAAEPDTLIARKCGLAVAAAVQRQARQLDPDDARGVQALDTTLRSGNPRQNPGTTADLIAAALYVLLRVPQRLSPE